MALRYPWGARRLRRVHRAGARVGGLTSSGGCRETTTCWSGGRHSRSSTAARPRRKFVGIGGVGDGGFRRPGPMATSVAEAPSAGLGMTRRRHRSLPHRNRQRSWSASPQASGDRDMSGGRSLDLDDGWIVVVPIALERSACSGDLRRLGPPVLLAEAFALDVALASGLYRRLTEHGTPMVGAVHGVRKTSIPAVVVIVFLTIGGVIMQSVVPTADTISKVLRRTQQRRRPRNPESASAYTSPYDGYCAETSRGRVGGQVVEGEVLRPFDVFGDGPRGGRRRGTT